MPTPELMTWVPAQRRWTKRYLGRRYYISARQLGTAETKEASLQAANQWWRDKQAELDYAYRASMRKPAPMEDLAAATMGLPPSSDLFGNIRELLGLALIREEEERKRGGKIESLPLSESDEIVISEPVEDAETIRRREVMGLLERLLFGEGAKLPEEMAKHLPPARVQQVEAAVKGLGCASAVNPDRTVLAQAEKWLSGLRARVQINDLTATRYGALKNRLSKFTAFLGEESDVSSITADAIDGFLYYCLSQKAEEKWSASYAQDIFKCSREWVRWLWERGLIDLPRNIDKQYRFGPTAKQIQTWTPEEVKRVIGETQGKLKLALLLMLNSGMTQQDVSDLQDSEVDWDGGRIIRKRGKTKKHDNVPTVNYLLWPVTFSHLKEHRSGTERVLLTNSGRPFVRQGLKEKASSQVDMFLTLFRKVRKRLGFQKSLKQLRKTSASLLESHEVYGRFTSLFLGHAPASMKDRHYAAPPLALFDEAITWLGQQLGLAD